VSAVRAWEPARGLHRPGHSLGGIANSPSDLSWGPQASGIWLARHRLTGGNVRGLIFGRRNPSLNDDGVARAHAASSPNLSFAFLAADPSFQFPAGESFESHIYRVRKALDVISSAGVPALLIIHVRTIRAALGVAGSNVGPAYAYQHGVLVSVPSFS
jgi:broad specificity phosphatase PhoE